MRIKLITGCMFNYKYLLVFLFLIIFSAVGNSYAELVKIEIVDYDTVLSDNELQKYVPYIITKGIVYFEINPEEHIYDNIKDLNFAPVNANGMVDDILLVKALFRESNGISFNLNDSGGNGDVKNSDNIWTTRIDIPQGVPKGVFHFDIISLNKDFETIFMKQSEKSERAYISFEVR